MSAEGCPHRLEVLVALVGKLGQRLDERRRRAEGTGTGDELGAPRWEDRGLQVSSQLAASLDLVVAKSAKIGQGSQQRVDDRFVVTVVLLHSAIVSPGLDGRALAQRFGFVIEVLVEQPSVLVAPPLHSAPSLSPRPRHNRDQGRSWLRVGR